MMKHNKKMKFYLIRIITLYIPLALFLIWALFPLYWMIVTSIKSNSELMRLTHPLTVKAPTLDQYKDLILKSDFRYWIKNSLVVALTTTIFSVIISSLAAYSLARIKFVGRWVVSRSVLFSYLIPRTILFLPLFAIIQNMRLTDTIIGLMLANLTFMVPFCTWILIGHFTNVPKEIEECSTIDGCSRLKTLMLITIPIAAPGIVVAAVFTFSLSWSEFLYPLVLNTSSLRQVVPVGLSNLITGDLFEWGQIMATGFIFTLPIIILFYPIQRYLASGLTAGAVKG